MTIIDNERKPVPEPLTHDLLEELLNSDDPIQFAAAHDLTKRTLPEYLQQLLDEKGLRRADVVRDAQISETYGYYIFTGQRNPKRDFVIRIAFAMGCSLLEANRMLQAAGLNGLYCKNRRDAIIIFGLDRGYTLHQTDEQLYRFHERTLQGDGADDGKDAAWNPPQPMR